MLRRLTRGSRGHAENRPAGQPQPAGGSGRKEGLAHPQPAAS